MLFVQGTILITINGQQRPIKDIYNELKKKLVEFNNWADWNMTRYYEKKLQELSNIIFKKKKWQKQIKLIKQIQTSWKETTNNVRKS